MVEKAPAPKVSFETPLETPPDRKSGRMFKFVVKGPTEHAKFTVPFVDGKGGVPQPKPNPRRSTEQSNQSFYNGAKPTKPAIKPETAPVPRIRRKSSGDDLLRENSRPQLPQKPPTVKPPSPAKQKPKWKEPPLATSGRVGKWRLTFKSQNVEIFRKKNFELFM